MKNRFTLLKFYTTIVSLVGVIGLAVGYGVAIYSGIQNAVITDEEFLANRNAYYGYDQCSQPKYPTGVAGETPVKPTEEEIKECNDKITASAVAQRDYNTKQNIIGGLVRGTLALILFVIHYPMLIKKSRDEDAN